jgi:hypothetical protein
MVQWLEDEARLEGDDGTRGRRQWWLDGAASVAASTGRAEEHTGAQG